MNNLMGWAFLGGAVYQGYIDNPVMGMLWLILAKQCWIHADIQEANKGQDDE